jgi:hypothetical protein
MSGTEILHETARRLRLGVAPGIGLDTLRAGLVPLPGVQSVRVNAPLRCVIVQHDGQHAEGTAALTGAGFQVQRDLITMRRAVRPHDINL